MQKLISSASPVLDNALNIDLRIIEDDKACVSLFVDAGVINLIPPQSPHNRGYALFMWREYFVVGICFRGHAKPEDNGYVAYLMPTATVDKDTACKMAVMLLDLDDLRNIDFRVIDLQPENN